MNLIQFKHRVDLGHEWYVQILNVGKHFPKPFKKKSLLQISVIWNEYASWPYLQVTMGNLGLFGLIFWIHKFGIDLDIISHTWNWDRLEEL